VDKLQFLKRWQIVSLGSAPTKYVQIYAVKNQHTTYYKFWCQIPYLLTQIQKFFINTNKGRTWFDDVKEGILKILKIWDVTLCQLTASHFDTAAHSFGFCDFFAEPFTGQSERHTKFHRKITVITFTLFPPSIMNDYNFLVPTYSHVKLTHISPYLAATYFGWSLLWILSYLAVSCLRMATGTNI